MKSALTFFLVLLLILLFTHIPSILFQRPQSVHMWAMCDRASVARNYAQESMNFFEPRVNETKEGEGITGLEFPIINYGAATLYKVFGFHEFLYRGLMLLVYLAGLFYAFLITGFFLKDLFYRNVCVLIIACSPIMTYYAANFIPDTASFGFIMMSWYYFFKLQREKSITNFLLFFVVTALATLIKITSAISVIVMFGLTLQSLFISKNNLAQSKAVYKWILVLLSSSLLITFSWYKYADWLSTKHNCGVFLMESRRPENWTAVKEVMEHVNKIWVEFYFHKPIYYLMLVGLVWIIFNFKKLKRDLRFVFLTMLIGVVSFTYLMFTQFKNHDYYIITLMPLLFFMFLTAFEGFENTVVIKPIANSVKVSLFVLLILAFNFNRKHQEFRMDEHCWLNDWSKYKDYQEVEPYVKSLGISKDERIVSICDDSPNISLYFLNLKGWSVSPNRDDSPIEAALNYGVEYLVLDDINQLNRPVFLKNAPKKIGQFKNIMFYKLTNIK